MSYTKFAARGAAIILILSVSAAFLGYVVRFVLARNLTVEDFGLFYAVFAFLGLFGIFKSVGLDKALAKFIPEFRQKKDKQAITNAIVCVALIQLLTNLVVLGIVYFFAHSLAVNYFHSEAAVTILKVMAVALFVDSFVMVLKYTFQGFKKPFLFEGIDLFRMILVIIFIIMGISAGYGLMSPVYAYLIAPIILLLIFGSILVFRVFLSFFDNKPKIELKLVKKLFSYGFFVMATGIGGILLAYTDIMMLTYFTSLHVVALYSIAWPTVKVLRYFPRAIGGVILPLTSELWTAGKKHIIQAGIESIYKYSIVFMMPFVFIMFTFPELLITVLFGKKFIEAALAMKILAIGILFSLLHNTHGNFFAGIGKPQITSKIVYIAASFNVVANFILIPMYGIVGAAIATSGSFLIMMIMELYNMKKYLTIHFPYLLWIKTLVAGIVFSLCIVWLKKVIFLPVYVETAVVIGLAGLVYTALIFTLKMITVNEIKDLYRRIVR